MLGPNMGRYWYPLLAIPELLLSFRIPLLRGFSAAE
jgi:hypothetical protein